MLSLSLWGNFINTAISCPCCPPKIHCSKWPSLWSHASLGSAELSDLSHLLRLCLRCILRTFHTVQQVSFGGLAWCESVIMNLEKGQGVVWGMCFWASRGSLAGTTGSIRVQQSQLRAETVVYKFLRVLAFSCLNFSFHWLNSSRAHGRDCSSYVQTVASAPYSSYARIEILTDQGCSTYCLSYLRGSLRDQR